MVYETLDGLELLVGYVASYPSFCGDVRHAGIMRLRSFDLEQHARIEIARDLDLKGF